jgi:hypothetical protein
MDGAGCAHNLWRAAHNPPAAGINMHHNDLPPIQKAQDIDHRAGLETGNANIVHVIIGRSALHMRHNLWQRPRLVRGWAIIIALIATAPIICAAIITTPIIIAPVISPPLIVPPHSFARIDRGPGRARTILLRHRRNRGCRTGQQRAKRHGVYCLSAMFQHVHALRLLHHRPL